VTARAVEESSARPDWHLPESLLIAAVVMACLAGLVLSTSADQDLWGHVTFGRDIVRDRMVAHTDVYSFAADRPWINHEWLSEVLMYEAYAALGASGLIGLKVLVCVAAAFVIIRQLRRYPLTFEVRAVLLTLAVLGTKAQTGQIRPQLFSVLLFTILLTVLTAVEDGNIRALVALPATFLFWANLHGGWIVGIAVLGLWTATELFDSRRAASDRAPIAIAAAASAAATLVNPFGVGLWTFLLQTVRLDRSDIADWQPVTYAADLLLVWALITATCIVLLSRARRVPPFFAATTLGLLAIGSFRVLRLESFFALATVMLLPTALATRQTSETPRLRTRTAPVSRVVGMVVIGVAACAIAGFLVLIARNGSCILIQRAGNPEPEATAFVRLNNLHGRMITWFDWGEYAIWHFSPDIKVSIDGRRETAYSADVMNSHLKFYRNQEPQGSTIADRWGADYVWLPSNLAVVSELRGHGWTPIFEGPASIILSRKQEGFSQPRFMSESRRCFPGP
jgi:hypothetical protein